MGDWVSFRRYVGFTEEHVVEGAFFRAVLALMQEKLSHCLWYVLAPHRVQQYAWYFDFPSFVVSHLFCRFHKRGALLHGRL